MTITPQRLAETLRLVLEGRAANMHTALPGIVTRYDASEQTVDVRPALRTILPSTDEDEADTAETLPELLSVPVAWPRGGGFYLHFPLEPGDTVLLVFSEADAGPWRTTGEVSDPSTPERHGLAGAVAIPGYSSRQRPIDGTGEDARAGIEGGAYVEFRPSEILAGGSDALAKADGLTALYNAIAGASVAVNDGGAAFKAAILLALAGDAAWVARATTTLKGG